MAADEIVVLGAREHNLKDITVRLPRNALICITGLSGSGKSSLAFDTIYAEGQRRYVESLSAYARQFLQMMEKPDVDSIDGLSPAISIDQKTTSRNPRSTVGTVTEIYDYLRLLYARIGRPHCPVCGRPIAGQAIETIVDQVLSLPEGTKFTVNAPVVRDRKGEYRDLLQSLRDEGFTRVKVDGEQRLLDEEIELDKKFKHTIEVVVDRLVMKPDLRHRLTDSIETALALADRLVTDRRRRRRGDDVLGAVRLPRARRRACPSSSRASSPSTRRTAPARAAPASGTSRRSTPTCSCPIRRSRSPTARSSRGRSAARTFYESVIQAIADRYEIDIDTPWCELTEEQQDLFLYGTGGDKRLRPVPQPDGPAALVHARLRGHRQEPRAPLPGDRLGDAARADRGVHVGPALLRVRGRPPEARGARGDGRRAQHPRADAEVGDAARSSSPRAARADRARARTSPRGSSRRSASGSRSSTTSASATSSSTARPRRSRAARRSACGSRPRSARSSSASSTSSTSRRSGSTSATTTA